MLFSNKKSLNKQRSRTPLSNNHQSSYSPFKSTNKGKKQLQSNHTLHTQNKTNMKLKTKQRFGILTTLQQIYSGLLFNQFDAFPIENIHIARRNIQKLYGYLKQQPLCSKHQDLLNLYCQNQKEVICVSCVYKGAFDNHKNHKIKKIQAVQKVLQLQAIRTQQKGRSIADQLKTIKQQMIQIERQVSEKFTSISNSTITIINQAIDDLNKIKKQLQLNLGLSYRRTTTIINRYSDCLETMMNMIQFNLQKSSVLNPLSKYLLLKQLNKESVLMDQLVVKFHQNKQLMQQWRKSSRQFEKLIIKKKTTMTDKQDAYVVTEF